MRAAFALAVLASCTPDEIRVRPILDLPAGDTDADAFAMIDEIELAVARAGSDDDIVTRRFERGEPLELPGVPFGEDLVVHMTGYTGTTISAYGRTCAFTTEPDELPEPHLFFARTVKHARTALMPLARVGGRGVAFEGSAVLAGGKLGATSVLEVERFDPTRGALVGIGRLSDREGSVQATLGSQIVILGGQLGSDGASFIELLDGDGTVDNVESDRTARIGMTATTLTDGRVIVIGGAAPGGSPVGMITELALAGPDLEVRDLRAVLAHPRSGHTATLLGGDIGAPVLIAGGVDATGAPVAIAELYKPLREELSDPLTFAPPMVIPRRRHQAARMPDGSVLIIGGVDAAGAPVRQLELFTVDAGFDVVGTLPQTAGVVDMTVTVLADGRILIAGGRTTEAGAATDTAHVARLDVLDGSVDVVPTDRLSIARAGHQAALLCDGTVMISGGTSLAEPAERYNPTEIGRR